MLHKGTLLILCLCTTYLASAQRLSLGLRAGLNYSTQITTTHRYIDPWGQPAGRDSRTVEDYKAGAKLGVFVRIALNRYLALTPGLAWNEKGFAYTHRYYDQDVAPHFFSRRNRVTFRYLALDFPLQFRFDREGFTPYLLLGARVETPLGYRQSLKATDVPAVTPSNFDFWRKYYQDHPNVNVGLLTAIGAEKRIGPGWSVFLELEYNPSISNTYTAPNLGMRNQLFALNAGLRRQQK